MVGWGAAGTGLFSELRHAPVAKVRPSAAAPVAAAACPSRRRKYEEQPPAPPQPQPPPVRQPSCRLVKLGPHHAAFTAAAAHASRFARSDDGDTRYAVDGVEEVVYGAEHRPDHFLTGEAKFLGGDRAACLALCREGIPVRDGLAGEAMYFPFVHTGHSDTAVDAGWYTRQGLCLLLVDVKPGKVRTVAAADAAGCTASLWTGADAVVIPDHPHPDARRSSATLPHIAVKAATPRFLVTLRREERAEAAAVGAVCVRHRGAALRWARVGDTGVETGCDLCKAGAGWELADEVLSRAAADVEGALRAEQRAAADADRRRAKVGAALAQVTATAASLQRGIEASLRQLVDGVREAAKAAAQRVARLEQQTKDALVAELRWLEECSRAHSERAAFCAAAVSAVGADLGAAAASPRSLACAHASRVSVAVRTSRQLADLPPAPPNPRTHADIRNVLGALSVTSKQAELGLVRTLADAPVLWQREDDSEQPAESFPTPAVTADDDLQWPDRHRPRTRHGEGADGGGPALRPRPFTRGSLSTAEERPRRRGLWQRGDGGGKSDDVCGAALGPLRRGSLLRRASPVLSKSAPV